MVIVGNIPTIKTFYSISDICQPKSNYILLKELMLRTFEIIRILKLD